MADEFDYWRKRNAPQQADRGAAPIEGESIEAVDMEKVEAIVKKMKKKYSSEGLSFEQDSSRMSELHGIITGEVQGGLEVQKMEDLREYRNPLVRLFGSIFLSLKALFQPFFNLLLRLNASKQLAYYLYSANMRYSAKQWIALTTVAALFAGLFLGGLTFAAASILGLPAALLAILLFLAGTLFTVVVMFLVPRQRAQARGNAISVELPFALRHIATQLSAGIGLYRTIQTVAAADYGPLSEEFSRVITETEEGTDTKDALHHLALRTQSRAFRNALMHIIRALKTGGNLSNIMNEIAEDVAFELRLKMRDFSEKMNFVGVIFIMVAIVVPVFVAILGGIRNSGAGGDVFGALPLTLFNLQLFYLIGMPVLMLWLFMLVTMMQPHV